MALSTQQDGFQERKGKKTGRTKSPQKKRGLHALGITEESEGGKEQVSTVGNSCQRRWKERKEARRGSAIKGVLRCRRRAKGGGRKLENCLPPKEN